MRYVHLFGGLTCDTILRYRAIDPNEGFDGDCRVDECRGTKQMQMQVGKHPGEVRSAGKHVAIPVAAGAITNITCKQQDYRKYDSYSLRSVAILLTVRETYPDDGGNGICLALWPMDNG